jgi:hypothetical protein
MKVASNNCLEAHSTIQRMRFFLLILFWVVAAMNKPTDEMVKIKQVAQIIVEQGIVLEGIRIRDELAEIGVFSRVELNKNLIRKIQRNQKVQEHMAKIKRQESAGRPRCLHSRRPRIH